jgi:hypothetical protein
MNAFEQLSQLNGRFTRARLISRGISSTDISRAINAGLLNESAGTISTVPHHIRSRKLASLMERDELTAGQQVSSIDPSTNEIKKLQVVKDDGSNRVQVIDPEDSGKGVDEVPADELAKDSGNEEEEGNSNEDDDDAVL